MRIKILLRSLMLLAALALSLPATAQQSQATVYGRVSDARTGEALAGAVITNLRTRNMAAVKNDGTFSMQAVVGAQELEVSFLGYNTKTITVNCSGNETDAGHISLEADAFVMDAVVVTAGVVTRDRQTPVAVSNITYDQIETKLSNKEFPEILKSTPSIYATRDNGGFGDSRINMRGFSSNNIGVLINGVPVNDMENGKVYWSNWAGLSDVTSFMQVQRGLGASKMGLSSVGGTINIVTKSTDAKKGGNIYYGIGNDGYEKLNFTVSTGLMDNNWAISLSGGRTTGDGYVRGTNFQAWTYFVNVAKMFADGRHRISFSAFGAPQWHGQRGNPYLIQDYRDDKLNGRRRNLSYGYMNGKIMSTGYAYNWYHKPQISLVHNWTIGDRQSLSTSLYASISDGGGRRMFGDNASWLGVDNGTGRHKPDAKVTADGLLDFNYVYEQNRNSPDGSAKVVMGSSVNSHKWYGLLSSYSNQLNDNLKVTGGFDGRYYLGVHRQHIDDLMGAQYYLDSSKKIYGRDPSTPLYEGDVIGYDNEGEVLWTGVFAQGEYTVGDLSAFLSGSITRKQNRYHNPGSAPINGTQVSEWVVFMPFSVKGGASYKFMNHHNVFANAGYFTIAPNFSNTFKDYSIVTNPDAHMEKVMTAEAGYGFADNTWKVDFNGYYTLWLDQSRVMNGKGNEIYNIPGINARHMGVELEAQYRPSSVLNMKGMFSLGEWIWRDNVDFVAYSDKDNSVLFSEKAYTKGVHVGNSAQITAALGADWTALKNFRVGADINWYGKNYADFQPSNRTNAADEGVDAWKMPDYMTIDLSVNYKFSFGHTRATFFANVNNLLDTWYIADARDGSAHNAETSLVYFGFGRTWSTGLKINF